MRLAYKDDKCVLIKFDEKQSELRKLGWLGDEAEARIFRPDSTNVEIRIFKDNGESYVISQNSNDVMVRMKARILLDFVKSCANA